MEANDILLERVVRDGSVCVCVCWRGGGGGGGRCSRSGHYNNWILKVLYMLITLPRFISHSNAWMSYCRQMVE